MCNYTIRKVRDCDMMIIPTSRTLPDPRFDKKALYDLNRALGKIPCVLDAICGDKEVNLIITNSNETEFIFRQARPILKKYLEESVARH